MPSTAGVGGAGGAWLWCRWAVAGPGRASRRRTERSSRRGRLAGGPPPAGTLSSPAPQLGVTVPGTPAVLQAILRAGRCPPARQAARLHSKACRCPERQRCCKQYCGRAAARRHARQPGPQLGVTVPGMPAVLQATLWAGRRPPTRQVARHAKQPGPTVRRDCARSTRGIAHHRRQSARICSQQRRQVDAPAARELGCLGAAREAVRQIHRVRLRIKRGQQRMRCDRD